MRRILPFCSLDVPGFNSALCSVPPQFRFQNIDEMSDDFPDILLCIGETATQRVQQYWGGGGCFMSAFIDWKKM